MGGVSIWTEKTKDAWLYNITGWRLLIGIMYLLGVPLLWWLDIVENCGLRCGRHSHYKCKDTKLEILDWFVTWKPQLKTSLFMTRHINFLSLGSTVVNASIIYNILISDLYLINLYFDIWSNSQIIMVWPPAEPCHD